MSSRVYVAGPMRGIKDFNFPAFFAAEAMLRRIGCDVFNPARADVEAGVDPAAPLPADFDMKEVCRRDIDGLLSCDRIYMLRGWSNSKGATAERAVAIWLGLTILGAAA